MGKERQGESLTQRELPTVLKEEATSSEEIFLNFTVKMGHLFNDK